MKTKEIKTDVTVIGAGTSGVFTSLHLLTKGYKVSLIERSPRIGGALVNSLVYPTAGFHSQNFTYFSSPLVEKFIRNSIENNLSLGHIKDPLRFSSTITPIHPTAYKILTNQFLNNKNLLFFPLSEIQNIKFQNQKIKSIILNYQNEKYEIKSKIFVDGSGNLITSFFIPLEFNFDLQNLQALTLIFKISNVDFNLIVKDIKNNPSEFYHKTDLDLILSQNFLSVSGYYSLSKQYLDNKELLLTRDRFLFFSDIDKNSVVVNTTRIFLKDIHKPENFHISELEKLAYKILLKQVIYIYNIMKKNIEGFRNSYISEVADFVGIRQFRNVKGLYTLTLQDIIEGKHFDDNVSIGTWPIDIHISNSIKEGKVNEKGYGVPYRCCISNYKNLLFVGKNISADNYSFSSLRIQATLMILGENIGRIIESCLNKKIYPLDIDYSEIKKTVKIIQS